MSKSGGTVLLHSRYSPVFDADGAVSRIVQLSTDVTEQARRDAEPGWLLEAIRKSHGVVTFDTEGLILHANQAFLTAVGYQLDEVVGRHHRILVEPSFAHSAEYASFWRELAQGHFQAGQYRRFTKSKSEVWLQAIYNPVFDSSGAICKIIKIATPVTDEKLRQADHQGQIAAIHNSLCVISFDLLGNIRDANENFLRSTGYRLSEVRGRHHSMFVEPDYAASEEYRSFWADLAAGRHKVGEFKRVGRHGAEIWLQATYNPILDLNGQPFRIVKYATVVTEQKLLQADLQGQIAAISKSQGLISFDLDGTILEANANFCDAVGYSAAQLIGQNHRMLVDDELAASEEYREFWQTLRQGSFVSGLYRRLGKDGRTVWIQASYNPILDLNGVPSRIVKFATDVTTNVEMADAYEDAKRQSQHDPATALPNRRRLLSFMNAILAQPERQLTVLYLDLDRFKPINDSFGHQAGDHVLSHVADRLRRVLTGEQIAARIGGDEFIVAAPDLGETECEILCTRLIDALSAPIPYNGTDLQVGTSIGVATSKDGNTPDELLLHADQAMYRSKQSGRGIFTFYTASRADRPAAFRGISEEMQRGLIAGEFHLDFQPRFNTASNQIVSVEALVRWRHPHRGLVPPADFIPSAEQSGLIVQLGEWILREACVSAMAWPGIGISVNVSPVQFNASNFVAMVEDVLRDSSLDPALLELEITEGVLITAESRTRQTLRQLKQLGIRISMDDFGTGYSSLSALRTFPFDAIKIDRQFVHDMGTREGGREVVQAILALARALNLSVTAEGVETGEQLSMLAADRCAELQGFLLARPMPAGQITTLLRQRLDSPDLTDTAPSKPSYIRRTPRKPSRKAV